MGEFLILVFLEELHGEGCEIVLKRCADNLREQIIDNIFLLNNYNILKSKNSQGIELFDKYGSRICYDNLDFTNVIEYEEGIVIPMCDGSQYLHIEKY